MPYIKFFKLTDDVIIHLRSVVPGISDPFLISRYVGFITVSAVTVYELAIKDILIDFGSKKHPVFGEFVTNHFYRLNGNIKLDSLKNRHIKSFGDSYVVDFSNKLNQSEEFELRLNGKSILSSYSNIITWRNDFAHEGNLSSFVTFDEAIDAYEEGKVVIDCLAKTMI